MIDTKTPAKDVPETLDPPPQYEPEKANVSTNSTQLPPNNVPKRKSVNYLYVSRMHEAIKGTYIVDPTLRIPEMFLPPLTKEEVELGEERKNLRLESYHNGVNVEVYLVQGGGEEGGSVVGNEPVDRKVAREDGLEGDDVDMARRKKTRLVVKSFHSSVNVKLHTPTGVNRDSFQLTASSYHSSVTLHLPRSFRGPLQLTTETGSVQLSPELTPAVTTFSEVDHTRKCFVGDYTEWTGVEDWQGDEVSLSSKHGSIKVRYVDENESGGSKGLSFYERMIRIIAPEPGVQ